MTDKEIVAELLAMDDAKKLHPDFLPYSDFPESEKEYDCETAIKTIMLLKKFGYEINSKL